MGINLLAANTNTIVLICMAVLFVIGLVFIIIWTVSAHKKKTQYMYWNSSTFGQSTNSSAHQLTVVTCPKCGSKNFEFVSEYHRCVWQRAFLFVPAIVFLIFIVKYFADLILSEDSTMDLVVAIVCAVIFAILQISIWLTESKTHIQGVCRDCGNIWYMN